MLKKNLEDSQAEKKARPADSEGGAGAPKAVSGATPIPKNKILFVQNLPPDATAQRLQKLFERVQGLKEVRGVAGNTSIAFVEFESEKYATIAMGVLNGFQVTSSHALNISYAKQ